MAKKSKKKGRKAMDEAMHVVKQSMSDTGGLGYFHVRSCSSSLHTVCLRPCAFVIVQRVISTTGRLGCFHVCSSSPTVSQRQCDSMNVPAVSK